MVAIALAAAATAASADHQLPAKEPGDVRIARAIADALARERIGGVRVECTNGLVVLTGAVDDNVAASVQVAAVSAST